LKIKLRTDPRISKFIEDNIYIEGKKIDLNLYEPMKFVYDLDLPNLVIIAGRQIGKSVYLGSKSSTKSIIKPNNRILYVAPLESQVKTFSKTKLQKIIDDSPYLRTFFPRKDNNVFFKQNTLGSYIELTYASLASAEPARVRGKSADDLFIDETQDIVPEALPVIKEVTTSSLDPTVTYTGTAKSEDNLTGILWKKATKIERVYQCPSCNRFNIIERENIGEKGLICRYCKKPLSQKKSKFVIVDAKPGSAYVAVRLPQVIMPIHQTPNKWKDVFVKFTEYSPDKFNQEVLGIPTGAGSRFITMEDLRKLCKEGRGFYKKYDNDFQIKYRGRIFMGIDWSGEGLDGDKSTTAVLIMGHRADGDIDVLYGEIIPPGDPNGTLDRIKQLAYAFRVISIAADAGMGAYQNAILFREFGLNKVLQIRYVSNQREPFKVYNAQANIVNIDKTSAIDTIMGILKQDFAYKPLKPTIVNATNVDKSKLRIWWPKFVESKPFFDHILAEFTQESSSNRKIWTHSPDSPDDALHALVFGFFGYVIKATNGKPLFY